MSHRAAGRKPYPPRRHGDTEKNKVKGKTGAHGRVRFPHSGESSLRAKISAASNAHHSYFNATTGSILDARHPGTSAAATATNASSAAPAAKTPGSDGFIPYSRD